MKKLFVEQGLHYAIERAASTRKPNIKFDGEFDARTMQLACSENPEGTKRWTIQLLAQKAVELEIVDSNILFGWKDCNTSSMCKNRP